MYEYYQLTIYSHSHIYIRQSDFFVQLKIDDFIKSADPKLRPFLENLNSGTMDFYQLEPITLEEMDMQFSSKETSGERDRASSLLKGQAVEYDADSEADTIHTLTPRPSLHRRRSTFKREKCQIR